MTWWTTPAETRAPSPAEKSAPVARVAGPASNTYQLVFGTKGEGKTLLARELAKRRAAAGGRVVWFDKTGKNGDMGTVVRSGAEFWSRVRPALRERKGFAIVVQFGWGKDHDRDSLWRLIYEIGDLLLVLDEADTWASLNSIDPNLKELVSCGRNNQVDLLATVQTPAQMHNILRGLNDVVVTFRQADQHYAEFLNDRYFHMAGGEQLILRLEKFNYLRVENGRVTRGRVPIPR